MCCLAATNPPNTQSTLAPLLILAGFLQGTFLANQIRKLQDGGPTVKNKDGWNSIAHEPPLSHCLTLVFGEGEIWAYEIDFPCVAGIFNFKCSCVSRLREGSRLVAPFVHLIFWQRNRNAFDVTKILSTKKVSRGYHQALGIVPFDNFERLNAALIANCKHVQCI